MSFSRIARGGCLWFLLLSGMTSLANAQSPTVAQRELLAQVQKQLQDNHAVLIDVREKSEWDKGHLAAAQLVPMSQLQDTRRRAELLPQFATGKVIYCHCQKGARAQYCAELLAELGFQVEPLKMSYETLVGAGFRETRPRTSGADALLGK